MSRPGPWCACVTWRSTKARSRSTCDARWPARSASPARPDFWVRRGEDRSRHQDRGQLLAAVQDRGDHAMGIGAQKRNVDQQRLRLARDECVIRRLITRERKAARHNLELKGLGGCYCGCLRITHQITPPLLTAAHCGVIAVSTRPGWGP